MNPSGSATTGVHGISVNVGSIAYTAGQKEAASFQGGATNIASPIFTNVYTPFPFSSGNQIGGQFGVAAGFPLDAGLFGNNLGWSVQFDDSYTDTSGFDLGFSLNGFVNGTVVSTGVTAQTMNFMTAGGQISGDGTITSVNGFRFVGLIPSGGTPVVTNLRGFYYQSAGGFVPTTEWSFYNANSNARQYFAGATQLGGTPGAVASMLDVHGTLKLIDTGSGFGTLLAPNAGLAADTTIVLPADDGLSGYGLITDGAGTTSWSHPKKVIADTALADSSTYTPSNSRDQIAQVHGSGGAVTIADLGDGTAQEGDTLEFIGTDDTNTVTFVSSTKIVVAGSCTLAENSTLTLRYVNGKYREFGRNA